MQDGNAYDFSGIPKKVKSSGDEFNFDGIKKKDESNISATEPPQRGLQTSTGEIVQPAPVTGTVYTEPPSGKIPSGEQKLNVPAEAQIQQQQIAAAPAIQAAQEAIAPKLFDDYKKLVLSPEFNVAAQRPDMIGQTGELIAHALDLPKFVGGNADQIVTGLSEMGKGMARMNPLHIATDPLDYFTGMLQTITGGATAAFGTAMTTPAGYVFTQGINADQVYDNGTATKIALSPLESYLPKLDENIPEGEFMEREKKAVDVLWSLALLHDLTHVVKGAPEKTLVSAIVDKMRNGKDVTGDELKTVTEATVENANPVTLNKLKNAAESLPKDIPPEDAPRLVAQLSSIDPKVLESMDGLTPKQKISIAPLLEERNAAEAAKQETIQKQIKVADFVKPIHEKTIALIDKQIEGINEKIDGIINSKTEPVAEIKPEEAKTEPQSSNEQLPVKASVLETPQEVVPSILNQETDLKGDKKRAEMHPLESVDRNIMFKGSGGDLSITKNKFGSKYPYYTDEPIYAKSFSLSGDEHAQKGKVESFENDFKNIYETDSRQYQREAAKFSGKEEADLTPSDFDKFNDHLKSQGHDAIAIKRTEGYVPEEGAMKGRNNLQITEYIDLSGTKRNAIPDSKKYEDIHGFGGQLNKTVNQSLREYIEPAINNGRYQKWISEGRMTASDAKTIIESAGLEVPKDIQELASKEKEQPIEPVKQDAEAVIPAKVEPSTEVQNEPPSTIESKRDIDQKKVDVLLNKVADHNTKPNSYTKQKSQLSQEINKLASELGMTVEKKERSPSNKTQYEIRQPNGKLLVREKTKADVEGKRLEDRPDEVQNLFHRIKNDIVAEGDRHSTFDHKLDVGLSQNEINKAVKNIGEGRYGYNEIQLLDGLERMNDAKQLEFARGSGNNVEKSAMPFDEYFGKRENADNIVEQMTDEELRPIDKMNVEMDDNGNIILDNEAIKKLAQEKPLNLQDYEDQNRAATAAEEKAGTNSGDKEITKDVSTYPDLIRHKERITEADERLATAQDLLSKKQKQLQDNIAAGKQNQLFGELPKKGELITTEADPNIKLRKEIAGHEGDVAKAQRDLAALHEETPKIEEFARRQLDITSGLDEARKNLADAKKKAKDAYSSSGFDPFMQKKRQARADRELLDAYVRLAKEHIKLGVQNVADFAKAIGEDISDVLKTAWDMASAMRENPNKGQQVTAEEVDALMKANKPDTNLKTKISDAFANTTVGKIAAAGWRKFDPFTATTKTVDAKYSDPRVTAIKLRENLGEMRRLVAMAIQGSEERRLAWEKLSPKEQVAFMVNMARGMDFEDVKLNNIARNYRNALDEDWIAINKIRDVPYIEDYLPQFWKDPDKARSFFQDYYAKNPLEGSKQFLEHRIYNDIMEGLKAGLELRDTNPENIVNLAHMNRFKFEMAHNYFDDLKSLGMIKFFEEKTQPPDGYTMINDALFKAKLVKDQLKGGGWYMPEDAARIVDRYMSRGLTGVAGNIAEGFREFNSMLNQAQLGLSAFHGMFTTLLSGFRESGNGIVQLTRGNVAEGLKNLMRGFTILPDIIFNQVPHAAKLNKQYKGLVDYGDERIDREIDGLMRANASIGLDFVYQTHGIRNLRTAFARLTGNLADGELGKAGWNSIKGLWAVPKATFELAAKPIMQWYVPKLKTMATIRLAQVELGNIKTPTDLDISRAWQKASDKVDNAFGQMVYDNLFLDKATKQTAFSLFRAFGWFYGESRFFGDVAKGAITSPVDIAKGKGISTETGMAIAMIGQTALMGAIYQYLMTGQSPQSAQDLFQPRDGTKNEDGSDHRVSPKTYLSDAMNMYEHGATATVKSKLAPSISLMSQLWNNKDFYGDKIYEEDDPHFQKGVEATNYIFNQFEPISLRKQSNAEETTQQRVQKLFGVMPVSANYTREDWQNKIVAEATANSGEETRTTFQKNRSEALSKLKGDIYNEIHSGVPAKQVLQEHAKEFQALKSKGYWLKSDDAFITEAETGKYENMFKNLPPESQLKVLNQITDEKVLTRLYPHMHTVKAFETLKFQHPELFKDHPEYNKFLQYAKPND